MQLMFFFLMSSCSWITPKSAAEATTDGWISTAGALLQLPQRHWSPGTRTDGRWDMEMVWDMVSWICWRKKTWGVKSVYNMLKTEVEETKCWICWREKTAGCF